ncbi:MAG: hypothetical protein ACLFPL_03990 [Candidatus Nanoarchaeia archaeon]
MHPLYVAQDCNSYNVLQCFWEDDRTLDDIENVTKVNRVHRKTIEGNLLECFPADRVDELKIDIIDSALFQQARSFFIFNRPSLVYNTGIIVPTDSSLEEQLTSTNHLVKHNSLVPQFSLYTVDWQKYFEEDLKRFIKLKKKAKRHQEFLDGLGDP